MLLFLSPGALVFSPSASLSLLLCVEELAAVCRAVCSVLRFLLHYSVIIGDLDEFQGGVNHVSSSC